MPPLRGMTVVRAIGSFPLRRPEIWMLSLAVLLLLVMARVSYTDWRLYRRADRHAVQIRDALTALEQFLDTMLDAEIGQRGLNRSRPSTWRVMSWAAFSSGSGILPPCPRRHHGLPPAGALPLQHAFRTLFSGSMRGSLNL